MYQQESTMNDVASMVGRLLKLAFISSDEAERIDKEHRSTMPDDWNPMKDSPTRRLCDAGIKLIPVAGWCMQ